MNNTQTIEKLIEMKFHGMARSFKESIDSGFSTNFTLDEYVAHLVESEWEERYNRKLKRLINQAKFRYNSNFEEVDFKKKRELDKNLFLRFKSCNFIKRSENIIITGPTGIGKSFLSSAIGNEACQKGYKVKYYNFIKLMDLLRFSKADGSYIKQMEKIAKTDLLLIDDFGLKPLDGSQRLMLLEIMEDRHGKKSTVITSQLKTKDWYEVIAEPTLADAILDRLLHSSYKIHLDGDSLRKHFQKKLD